jgi:hypothetical protein
MPMQLRWRGSWGTRPQTRTLRVSSTSPTPSLGGRVLQEVVRHVQRQLEARLPAGRQNPSPRSFLGEAGDTKGSAPPKVEEHHHLLRVI